MRIYEKDFLFSKDCSSIKKFEFLGLKNKNLSMSISNIQKLKGKSSFFVLII